jgi:DNA-binding transcriptional LysR family regulator
MLDRRLNHVVAVAHCGSFTRAAERVGMSQSGMTKSIADLERELGYPLFFRTRRGVLPTEDGKRFVDQASRLLADARVLLAGHGSTGRHLAEPLKIGVGPASLQWLLIAPLAQLVHDQPSVRIELVASTFTNIVHLLASGALDLVLGLDDDFSEWGELHRERIATMYPVLFVRKEHPILDGRHIDAAELSRWTFITPSGSRPYGGAVRALFANAEQWQHHLHVVDYFSLVRRLVAGSDAIGVTTRKYAASPVFAGHYASLPGENPLPHAVICCATRTRWEPTAGARALLRILQRHVPLEIGE